MINQEGQACRKCGTAVVKKTPKNKKKRLKQSYYYEWYLYCPGCDTMYMVDEAKRFNKDRPIGMESTKTSPMTVYLGSPDNQVQASAAADMPVLLSFVLAGRHKFIEQYLPTWRALLLDCGAYSAMTRKINIDGHAYRDWYQKFEHIADAYAGIDDIDGDWKKSWANYNEFGGFPTIHDTDPPDFLADLIALAAERNKWIGIGLQPPREGKERWIRSVCDQIPKDFHVHGWALRSYTHIARLDSVDSTNWWRDAMDLRVVPLCKHLTYTEALEIVVKRYRRWTRTLRDPVPQTELFK
tara:strand:- start:723 stop:1613 length:891 start_codon:yes stop_codon:yes gene_type:complete